MVLEVVRRQGRDEEEANHANQFHDVMHGALIVRRVRIGPRNSKSSSHPRDLDNTKLGGMKA